MHGQLSMELELSLMLHPLILLILTKLLINAEKEDANFKRQQMSIPLVRKFHDKRLNEYREK